MEDVQLVNDDDLYMLLKVDRTANAEQIRSAYLRLASCLHPDKACNAAIQKLSNSAQDGPVLDAESRLAALRRVRKRANAQFVRVYRAYRVLSDSIKKQIYDEYGVEGLATFELREINNTIGAPLKHPKQVRALLDELLSESMQRRLEATLGISGRISAESRCLPLLGADGQVIYRNIVPEVTQLLVQQSMAIPVGETSNLTVGGYALHHSGVGMGSTFVALRHNVSASRWLGAHVDLGHRPKVSLSSGELDKAGGQHQVHMSVHEAGRGLRWTSTKRIHPSAVCSVSLGTDPDDGFTLHAFKLVKGGLGKVRAELRVGAADLGLRLSYQQFVTSAARTLQMGLKVGTRGMEVELGAKRMLPSDVKFNTAIRVSLQGVTAVLRAQRGGFQFQLPVLVSAIASGWGLVVGGVIPAAVDGGVGWLLATSWKRRAARLRAERQPMQRRQLLREISNAASQTALMQSLSERNAGEEREKGGLVIAVAKYGCRLSRDCGTQWWVHAADQDSDTAAGEEGEVGENGSGPSLSELLLAPNINVTVPLQFFVRDSSLLLPSPSKSSILGFYTPSPCRRPRRPRPAVVLVPQAAAHTTQEEEWDYDWDTDSNGFSHNWQEREHRGEGASPASPQLYIRYTFAGRVFEETFQDNDEVSLPSPTSTYMGEDDVCSATTPRRGELLQT